MFRFIKLLTVSFFSVLLLIGIYSASAQTELYFVNVGKGDAIIVRTEEGYTCLIDAGKKSAEDSIRSAFEHLGIDQLDAVFLTHTDNDHAGGLKWLKTFPVSSVYTSSFSTTEKKHPADKLAKSLKTDCIRLSAGDSIEIGHNSTFHVLAPSIAFDENEDDNSLVMMLETPDGKVLLTGDMEMDESYLLLDSNQSLECDVLKVPNHGDSDACPYELIEASAAKYAIISTSTEEKPNTPSPRVLDDLREFGCETYITQDYQNGILVQLDAGSVRVTGN